MDATNTASVIVPGLPTTPAPEAREGVSPEAEKPTAQVVPFPRAAWTRSDGGRFRSNWQDSTDRAWVNEKRDTTKYE